MIHPDKKQFVQDFADEKGGMTAFGLFMLATIVMVGGYAVDVGNVMMSRTQSQIAADAAGHAALLTREVKTESEAVAAATNIAKLNMPEALYGSVLNQAEIVFGDYDQNTLAFSARSGSRNAVQVTTKRNLDRGNAIETYMMKLVGLDEWELSTTAVFTTYHPTCLKEGFVAEGVVDIQSNNSFSNGFCIHSNSYVSLNSNNYFEPGTVVSMPNLDELELPNSGFKTNGGLQAALREGGWNIRIVNRIADLIQGLKTWDPLYLPSYITSTQMVTLKSRNVTQADLVAGRVCVHRRNQLFAR